MNKNYIEQEQTKLQKEAVRSIPDSPRTLTGNGYTLKHFQLYKKSLRQQAYREIDDILDTVYDQYQPTQILATASAGWASRIANLAIKYELPLYLVLPYRGYYNRYWPEDELSNLKKYATKIYYMADYYLPLAVSQQAKFIFDQLMNDDKYVTNYKPESMCCNGSNMVYAQHNRKDRFIEYIPFEVDKYNRRKYKAERKQIAFY